MEYASALRVDLTTLPICFECHTIGENSEVSFTDSFGVQAIINNPCWALNCLADAKLASPKLAKQMSFMGIGRTMIDVSANCLASLRTLLPSRSVLTVAWVIPFWRFATFVAMSGLE